MGEECGYWEDEWNNRAYYKHCGSGRIRIRVDYWEWPDGYRCPIYPGNTYLGTTHAVRNAWYVEPC